MATSKRVTFNEDGEPRVVVTIDGWHDAFRFAWAMSHLQCDFAGVGRRIGGSLRRRVGAAEFKQFHERFTGNRTLLWLRHDAGPATVEELQELLPNAAIETRDDGELVIYTGWARGDDGALVDWCYVCDSGKDPEPGMTCSNCGRVFPEQPDGRPSGG